MTRLVLLYGNELGCFLWRNNTMGVNRGNGWQAAGGIQGGVGSPDVLGILPDGTFIGIEIKNKGDRLSSQQITFHDMVCSRNGRVLIITTRNIEEKLNELKDLAILHKPRATVCS
jgi:hypothetical protein